MVAFEISCTGRLISSLVEMEREYAAAAVVVVVVVGSTSEDSLIVITREKAWMQTHVPNRDTDKNGMKNMDTNNNYCSTSNNPHESIGTIMDILKDGGTPIYEFRHFSPTVYESRSAKCGLKSLKT